jgi:hypothetical protein
MYAVEGDHLHSTRFPRRGQTFIAADASPGTLSEVPWTDALEGWLLVLCRIEAGHGIGDAREAVRGAIAQLRGCKGCTVATRAATRSSVADLKLLLAWVAEQAQAHALVLDATSS